MAGEKPAHVSELLNPASCSRSTTLTTWFRVHSRDHQLLKLADEFPPVKFWFTQGDQIPNGCYARRVFIPIEIANVDYADKIYKRFKF